MPLGERLDRGRRYPSDDCGGVDGYYDFLEKIQSPIIQNTMKYWNEQAVVLIRSFFEAFDVFKIVTFMAR